MEDIPIPLDGVLHESYKNSTRPISMVRDETHELSTRFVSIDKIIPNRNDYMKGE
jgi:hypothetical protein